MRWDSRRRAYVDDRGRVIPAKEIRTRLEEYIESEQADIEDEVDAFFEQQKSGLELAAKIVLTAVLFSFLADKIRQWHRVAGTIAYGGEDQLTPERLNRIAEKVDTELKFLAGFEAAVERSLITTEVITEGLSSISVSLTQGETLTAIESAIIDTAPSEVAKVLEKIVADTLKVESEEATRIVASALTDVPVDGLMWGNVSSRSRLYAESLYATYENNVAAREVDSGASLGRRVCEEDTESCEECVAAADTFFAPIEDLPEIGSLQCFSNCRCFFEFAEPNPNLNLSIDLPSQNVNQ